MSASSIASSCDCSRTAVLHIIKDIFLQIVEIIKEGKDEISLDIKIGKLHFHSDSKLAYFSNYEEGEIESL